MKLCHLPLFTLFVVLLLACNDTSRNRVAETLKMMQGRKVAIPIDSFVCYEGLCEVQYDKVKLPEYKLVVYVDSNSCTSCTLSNMHVWDGYVKLAAEHEGEFSPVFIFAPAKDMIKNTKLKILAENFRHPIFIDTACVFSRLNPNLPTEEEFHVFLLDGNDSVLVVGDPVKNKSVGEVLQRCLAHRLGSKSLAK